MDILVKILQEYLIGVIAFIFILSVISVFSFINEWKELKKARNFFLFVFCMIFALTVSSYLVGDGHIKSGFFRLVLLCGLLVLTCGAYLFLLMVLQWRQVHYEWVKVISYAMIGLPWVVMLMFADEADNIEWDTFETIAYMILFAVSFWGGILLHNMYFGSGGICERDTGYLCQKIWWHKEELERHEQLLARLELKEEKRRKKLSEHLHKEENGTSK